MELPPCVYQFRYLRENKNLINRGFKWDFFYFTWWYLLTKSSIGTFFILLGDTLSPNPEKVYYCEDAVDQGDQILY